MKVGQYCDKVISSEYKDVAHAKVIDIMKVLHKFGKRKFYITQNKKPFYVIKACDIFENILKNELNKTLEELIKLNPLTLNTIDASTDLLSVYNVLRKQKLDEIIVVNKKGELIGDIDFKLVSLKLADVAIKDEVTGDFNEKYFNLFLEEHRKFTEEDIGFICIFINNGEIIRDLYGSEKYEQILKYYSSIINKSVRDVDFVFRIDNRFIVVTFNDLNITNIIYQRLQNNFLKEKLEITQIEFKLSHFPTIGITINDALEKCAPEESDLF